MSILLQKFDTIIYHIHRYTDLHFPSLSTSSVINF